MGVKATHVLCFAYFVAFLVLVIGEGSAWHLHLLQALGVADAASLVARPWTLLTHILIHRDPLEGVLAVGILLLAGLRVEERLGTARFTVIYLTTAALVALAHVALVEVGVAQGRLLTGSLGGSIGLLTAYLFLLPDQRVGSLPYPICYVVLASALLALVWLIGHYDERALRDRTEKSTNLAFRGENRSPDERVDLLWQASVERRLRPDHLVHLLGFAFAGLALGGTLAASSYQARYRVRREIRGLQEEVEVRARVEQLLEKISCNGMGSLSRTERKFLRYASRFYRTRPAPQAAPSVLSDLRPSA